MLSALWVSICRASCLRWLKVVGFLSASWDATEWQSHFSFAADVPMGEPFLLAIPSLASLNSTQALAFLILSLKSGQGFYSPPGQPVPASTFCSLSFCVWAQSGIPCSAKSAFCHVCYTSHSSGWIILMLWGGFPWRSRNCSVLSAPQGSHPWYYTC